MKTAGFFWKSKKYKGIVYKRRLALPADQAYDRRGYYGITDSGLRLTIDQNIRSRYNGREWDK